MEIPDKYPLSIRILHWLMAAMIIGIFVAGLLMGTLERGTALRDWVYFLHKSFGVTVLMLALLRLFIRFRSHLPPLPGAIPAMEKIMAHLGHLALYGFMLVLPLSGIVMTNSYGFAAPWFGLELPKLVGIDKARGHLAGELHEYLAYALMALVAVHALAALKHYVKERINLFRRMW